MRASTVLPAATALQNAASTQRARVLGCARGGVAPRATRARPGSSGFPRRVCVIAQSRHIPDAKLEHAAEEAAALERLEALYLSAASAAGSPPPAAHARCQQQVQQLAATAQHLENTAPHNRSSCSSHNHNHNHHHHHQHHPLHNSGEVDYITCSTRVCVEHHAEASSSSNDTHASTSIISASGSVSDEEEECRATSLLGRLFDLLPISPRTRGIVMLNLLVLLVASNWVVVKDMGAQFDPFGFAFLRFAVAAAAFSPFMKAAAKDRRILMAGAEVGLWTAMGYITQSVGLLTTDASRASFLSTFTVLVVPFLAGISGKGVSLVTWASCIAALLGVGLLEQGGAPPGIGDVWSMVSALAFGVQIFRTEHWARVLGNNSSMSLMSVVLTTTMLFSALAAGAAHPDAFMDMVQHPGAVQQLLMSDQFPWQQILYCGLLTTDLALMMEVFALQDVSSVEAAIIYTLEPVLGAGFAWVLLGERLGAKGFAGAAIILASSVVTQLLGGHPAGATEAQEADVAAGAAAASSLPAEPVKEE